MGACATAPKNFGEYDSGKWKVKALIQDKVKNKSFVAYMDVMSKKEGKLRLDVESSLGIHLASMFLNEDQFSMILVRDKKFYTGKPNKKSLRRFLPLEASPKLFVDLFFDQEPKEKNTKCDKDSHGLLSKCSIGSLDINWNKRSGNLRVIQIETPKAKLQMQVHGFQPNVQFSESEFSMKAPAGFKVYKLK